jgi:hypothetical protein
MNQISLESELRNAKKTYLLLKEGYKEVVDSIKKEISEPYAYPSNGDKIRHAICLYFGEYVGKYALNEIPKGLKSNQAKVWKTNKALNYWDLRKEVYADLYSSGSSEYVGFVCEGKHLQEALDGKMKDLWWFYMKEHRSYVESLQTFKGDCSSEKIDLLEIFMNYNNKDDKDFILETIHKPSLGLKNIVIYIKDY